VKSPDGTVRPLVENMPIYMDDIVETEKGGECKILFTDETDIAIAENQKFKIDSYVYDPATDSGTTGYSWLRGAFIYVSGLMARHSFASKKELDEVKLGSIGIRG
jgi:hypothetical protein